MTFLGLVLKYYVLKYGLISLSHRDNALCVIERYFCGYINKKAKKIITVNFLFLGLAFYIFNSNDAMGPIVAFVLIALIVINEIFGIIVFSKEEIRTYDHAYLNIYINGSKPVFEVSILDLSKKKNWFIIKRGNRDIRVNESNVIKIEYYGEEKKVLVGYDFLHFKETLEEL